MSDALTVTRSSAATVLDAAEQQISDIAANLPRLETVATAGPITITARAEAGAAYTPFAADLARDVLLVGKWVGGNLAQLYARSQVGAEGTLLLDVTATVGQAGYSADAAAFYADNAPFAKYLGDCRVMADGSYIVSVRRDTGYNGAKYLMAIFRSADAGATWTRVLRTVSAGAPSPQSIGVSGTRAVCASYCDPVQANTSVWLSEDNGATWTEIWTQTAIAEHVHFVIFDPVLSTRLWVVLGETTFTKLARLDYAGGVWTYTDVISGGLDQNLQFGCSLPIWIGSEIFLTGSYNYAYNPTTGLLREWLSIPSPVEGANTAYGYQADKPNFAPSQVPTKPALIGGLLYAPLATYGDYAAGGDFGLLVSPDSGRRWTRVNWRGTTKGVTHLVEWRGLLWAGLISSADVQTMGSFPPPHVALATALRLEAAVTNALGVEASTWTKADGSKPTRAETGWSGSYSMMATFGNDSIKGDGVTPAGNYGYYCGQIDSGAGTTNIGSIVKNAAGAALNDKISAIAWVKPVGAWPRTHKVWLNLESNGATVEMTGSYSSTILAADGEWLRLETQGKCTAAGTGTFYVQIRVYSCDVGSASNPPTAVFNASADTCTPSSGVWPNGTAVRFKSGTLAAPLVNSTTYYVGDWDGTKFCIYTDPDLAPAHKVDLTNAGTPTSYVYQIATWSLKVDRVMVVKDANNWYAGSFQPGGTARTAEYADATLTGLPAAGWTVGIEWRPESGYKEYAADLGILSIGDGAHWMDLTWDASEAKFCLTDDGTDTASQAAAMKWRHFDNLRLVLTSDGTDTWLYVVDPTNGVQTVLKCTAVNIGKPTTLRLGANHDGSLGACGHFLNVFKKARLFSAADLSAATVYVGLSAAGGAYDLAERAYRAWGDE